MPDNGVAGGGERGTTSRPWAITISEYGSMWHPQHGRPRGRSDGVGTLIRRFVCVVCMYTYEPDMC